VLKICKTKKYKFFYFHKIRNTNGVAEGTVTICIYPYNQMTEYWRHCMHNLNIIKFFRERESSHTFS